MKRIVILLLVITGLYIVFNQTFHLDGFAFAGSKDGRAAVSDDINSIDIHVGGVNTKIIPEDRKDVKAVLTGKGSLMVNEDGNKIEVKTKMKWFNWWFKEKRELNIYVPEDYNKNMAITLGSGKLEFSAETMKLDEVSLDIGSGNVHLRNLEVNEFKHDVSSGNVVIDKLKTNTGKFDISSGNLDLNHYSGALDADVSSGKLSVEMDQLSDEVEIDLSSGKVNLDLPDNANFRLDGEVSSGKISSDFSLTSKESDKKGLKGTHGSGKHEINISVSSGDVDIF